MAAVSTNPATLLGYGTWAAWGTGRVPIGRDTGQSAGDTGGAATHNHAAHSDHAALTHSGATVANHTDVTNHVHVQSVNSAATGGLSGYTADTSTSSSVASGYSTANPTSGGVAAQVHSVGQASQHAAQSHSAHDLVSHLPPFVVVYMWQRTA